MSEQFRLVFVNFLLYFAQDSGYRSSLLSLGNSYVSALIEDFENIPFARPMPAQSYMTIGEQVAHYGYGFEEHQVRTEDGWVLKAFRVPGKAGELPTGKPPVIM